MSKTRSVSDLLHTRRQVLRIGGLGPPGSRDRRGMAAASCHHQEESPPERQRPQRRVL